MIGYTLCSQAAPVQAQPEELGTVLKESRGTLGEVKVVRTALTYSKA
jgi:hypothetical protein